MVYNLSAKVYDLPAIDIRQHAKPIDVALPVHELLESRASRT
jgi:hypothetical protein